MEDSGARSGRWMALDVGSKTIGVAITDPLKITARPLTTLPRSNLWRDVKQILELIHQYQVDRLIIGRPHHLGGTPSVVLKAIEPLAKRLGSCLPVEWAEERLSTKEAEQLMAEIDLPQVERKKRRHEFSAAVILRWYLNEID